MPKESVQPKFLRKLSINRSVYSDYRPVQNVTNSSGLSMTDLLVPTNRIDLPSDKELTTIEARKKHLVTLLRAMTSTTSFVVEDSEIVISFLSKKFWEEHFNGLGFKVEITSYPEWVWVYDGYYQDLFNPEEAFLVSRDNLEDLAHDMEGTLYP